MTCKIDVKSMTYPGPLALYQNRQVSREASKGLSVMKTLFHNKCNKACSLNLRISVAYLCKKFYCLYILQNKKFVNNYKKNKMKFTITAIVFILINHPQLDYFCILTVYRCANIEKQIFENKSQSVIFMVICEIQQVEILMNQAILSPRHFHWSRNIPVPFS